MGSDNREAHSITLGEIEQRLVDPSIIRKMVTGYFDRVGKPLPPVDKHVLTISCVDSRLPPGLVLGHDHGQAFAVQTVANVVPVLDFSRPLEEQSTEVAAALEYTIRHAGIKEVIVMGHTDCGGAEALLLQHKGFPNVTGWMNHVDINHSHGHPDIETFAASMQRQKQNTPLIYEQSRREAERHCLHTSMRNIKSMPFVRDAIQNAGLSLASVACDLKDGKLSISCDSPNVYAVLNDLAGRFKNFEREGYGENGYMHELAKGQYPKALIVTGISPYVAPENVFGIEPGDSFMHRRLAGNYHHEKAPGGLSATMEFAIKAKAIESLVFVGHKRDINRDYAEGKMDPYPLVTGFMEKSVPELREWRESGMNPDSMRENALRSTHFNALKHPDVKSAVQNGKLSVVTLFVDSEQGSMKFFDPHSNEFLEVVPPAI